MWGWGWWWLGGFLLSAVCSGVVISVDVVEIRPVVVFCGVVASVDDDRWSVWSAVCSGVVISVDNVGISVCSVVFGGRFVGVYWGVVGIVDVLDLGHVVVASSMIGYFLLTWLVVVFSGVVAIADGDM